MINPLYIGAAFLVGGLIFMNKDKTISKHGLNLLKNIEGFSPTPYRDAHGFSIGYGHFITKGENYNLLAKPEAEVLLAKDLKVYEDVINTYVTVNLSQNMFDALVLLVYNIGGTNFRTSTLLRVLNLGDYLEAQNQFKVWIKSRKSSNAPLSVNSVLVSRREKEAKLFFS